MKRLISLAICLSLTAAVAAAQEKEKVKSKAPGPKKAGVAKLSDPLEILKKADAAAKTVKSVKYHVVIEPSGAAEQFGGKAEGDVIMSGVLTDGGRPTIEKYYVELKVQAPNSGEIRHISGGTDGEDFYVVHHAEKTAYQDIDPAVMGRAGRTLTAGFMIEYLLDGPFDDEMNGRAREFKGIKKVAGEECYVVHVVYQNEQAPQATWHFSVKDLLPRCRVDEYTLQDGSKGAIRKTISKLEVNPKLAPDAFKLKLPEGYTQTDDFAP